MNSDDLRAAETTGEQQDDLDKGSSHDLSAVDSAVIRLGERIKALRKDRGMALAQLAQSAGLSPSMLSMVERGKTNPSIGTVLAVAAALNVSGNDLLADDLAPPWPPPQSGQFVMLGHQGVRRRVLLHDGQNRVEIAENEYDPGASSSDFPREHHGREYGIVVAGELTVEINGQRHVLKPGNTIGFDSRIPHRFSNEGPVMVKTYWFNMF